MALEETFSMRLSTSMLQDLERAVETEGHDSLGELLRQWLADELDERYSDSSTVTVPVRVHKHNWDYLQKLSLVSYTATPEKHVDSAVRNYMSVVRRHEALLNAFFRAHPNIDTSGGAGSLASAYHNWTRTRNM